MKNIVSLALVCGFVWIQAAHAGADSGISGTVLDNQGIAVPSAPVQLKNSAGQVVKETKTSMTGDFQFFPLDAGDYQLSSQLAGFAPYQSTVHVASGGTTQINMQLVLPSGGQEIVLEVKAKRHLVKAAAQSSKELNHEEIEALPGGNQVNLARLIETTTPGVVQGPFGQTFIRGNHADVQYQIDGVQLPDSVSGTFGDAFSPRNIDHFETITGGIPAEYGERLAAVVNIVTKSGPEAPGGSVDIGYGSYNTFKPQALFGGSNKDGDLHYFVSAGYTRTDRGLDTPNPVSTALADQGRGGSDASHDTSDGNSQFAKIDWLPDNSDKVSLVAFQSHSFFQIPTYPGSFNPQDPYFGANQSSPYADAFGNTAPTNNGVVTPLFNYTPPGTDDTQANEDAYLQLVWKHTFSDRAFLQTAPYWKYSQVQIGNDQTNDLSSATAGSADFIPGSTPSSFTLSNHVNNVGLKTDYSVRPNDFHLFKAGFQLQASRAIDAFQISGKTGVSATDDTLNPTTAFGGGGTDTGYLEVAYVQDEWTISKSLILNAGIRFTATQFHFPDADLSESQFQPRVGLSYFFSEQTKAHLYYGRLFQPAPLEDLREAFDNVNGSTTPSFFDIKAEKDNFYEVGLDQQLGSQQVATLNVYYKDATDMLDDTQLLNTSISSPFNFAHGYAYGLELSVKGKLNDKLSEYVNYSYDIAKGEGISGGTFAVSPSSIPQDTYLYLDHVQLHTVTAGLTYAVDRYYGTVQGLFGSGLRTGPNNTLSLPSHLTFDLTAGYVFRGDSWLSRWKLSGDILNLFDNPYPITIANGFNGSHYEAGRVFFVRLSKDI